MSICQGFFGKGSGNDTDCVCELRSWHKQKHPALSQPTAQQTDEEDLHAAKQSWSFLS